MTTRPRLLAVAQLLRLPNVFTAFADVLMAAAVTQFADPGRLALLLLASGCLYLGGMVWNDWFDLAEDEKARPFRPLPSGRITTRTALWLGIALLAAGVGFGAMARRPDADWWADSLVISVMLAAAVLLYDGALKRTPVGPVGMGFCRFLNVLLGLSAAPVPAELAIHLAATIGVYIVGVTWFARTEEGTSGRRPLLAATTVMAVAVGLAATVPAHLPTGAAGWYFPYLLIGFGFFVGVPIYDAIRDPQPKRVQAAVKRCIFGLVVLDAVLATAFVGVGGLLLVLLLLPATWLGRRVYST